MRHEDVIERVDIFALLDKLGIEGKIHGNQYYACCPFPEHDDSTPSFSIAISGDAIGMWRCWGCEAKGNTIHLVQRVLGLERPEAEKKIAEWFGFSNVISSPSTSEISKLLEKKEEREVEEDMIRIPLPKISNDKSRIIDYLMTKRKYTEKQAWDVINHFNIGFAESGYYRQRAIIPVYDSIGSLITFEGYDITGQQEKKKLYPKGSPMSRLLFNNHNVGVNYTWVVEGVWDAVRLWSFGEPVIATFGAHLSGPQAQMLIKKYADIMLLFDGDEAGRKARDKASAVLMPYVNVFEVDLWYGDPAELTKEEFRELVRMINIKPRTVIKEVKNEV